MYKFLSLPFEISAKVSSFHLYCWPTIYSGPPLFDFSKLLSSVLRQLFEPSFYPNIYSAFLSALLHIYQIGLSADPKIKQVPNQDFHCLVFVASLFDDLQWKLKNVFEVFR